MVLVKMHNGCNQKGGMQMVMQRWEPFRELRRMENTMNHLWDRVGYREGTENWNILLDVLEKGDNIEVKASIPGVNPEDIEVAIEDNILSLKAERNLETEREEGTYLIQERASGSFYRALHLPDAVDTNKIDCRYDNGVLTVTMPKAEEKKRKQIKVKAAGGAKAIGEKK